MGVLSNNLEMWNHKYCLREDLKSDFCQGVELLRVDEMALVVNGEGNGAWEAQIFKGQAEEVETEKV